MSAMSDLDLIINGEPAHDDFRDATAWAQHIDLGDGRVLVYQRNTDGTLDIYAWIVDFDGNDLLLGSSEIAMIAHHVPTTPDVLLSVWRRYANAWERNGHEPVTIPARHGK